MSTTRIIETFDIPHTYADPPSCCYLEYYCEHCERKNNLVEPYSHMAKGAIMKEVLARDIKTREITKIGKIYFMCIECIKYNKFREMNKNFLV